MSDSKVCRGVGCLDTGRPGAGEPKRFIDGRDPDFGMNPLVAGDDVSVGAPGENAEKGVMGAAGVKGDRVPDVPAENVGRETGTVVVGGEERAADVPKENERGGETEIGVAEDGARPGGVPVGLPEENEGRLGTAGGGVSVKALKASAFPGVVLNDDSTGGVFAREFSVAIGPDFAGSDGSAFTPAAGNTPKGSLGDAGLGLVIAGAGTDWEVCMPDPSFPPSSPPDAEAPARGELRVGRVVGRPRPKPGGWDVDDGSNGVGETTEGASTGSDRFSGDPGGVVLSSLVCTGNLDVLSELN